MVVSKDPKRQLFTGFEWEHYFRDTCGADNVEWITKDSKYANAVFADDEKLVSHYWKHRKVFTL